MQKGGKVSQNSRGREVKRERGQQTSGFGEMGLCGEKAWFEEKEQILEELRLRSGSLELTSWCARSFDSMEPQSRALSFSISSSDATSVLRGDHNEKKSGSAIEHTPLCRSVGVSVCLAFLSSPSFWVQIVCDRLVCASCRRSVKRKYQGTV